MKEILLIQNVHKGELEAISLAVEMGIGVILLDDAGATRKSNQLNLRSFSSFDILLTLKKAGLIKSVKQVLETMSAENERIDDVRILNTLLKANEVI